MWRPRTSTGSRYTPLQLAHLAPGVAGADVAGVAVVSGGIEGAVVAEKHGARPTWPRFGNRGEEVQQWGNDLACVARLDQRGDNTAKACGRRGHACDPDTPPQPMFINLLGILPPPGVAGAGVAGASVVPGGIEGALVVEITKYGQHGQHADTRKRFGGRVTNTRTR